MLMRTNIQEEANIPDYSDDSDLTIVFFIIVEKFDVFGFFREIFQDGS